MIPGMKLATLTLAAAMLVGCANKRLPGTDIPDTKDTRAIVQVVDKYRAALEDRDSEALIALLADSFHDNAGTGTPEDDLDYASVREIIPKRLRTLDKVRADFSIRTIDVEGQEATVVYKYDTQYEMPAYKSRPKRDSDLQRMRLRRMGNDWKIVSGI